MLTNSLMLGTAVIMLSLNRLACADSCVIVPSQAHNKCTGNSQKMSSSIKSKWGLCRAPSYSTHFTKKTCQTWPSKLYVLYCALWRVGYYAVCCNAAGLVLYMQCIVFHVSISHLPWQQSSYYFRQASYAKDTNVGQLQRLIGLWFGWISFRRVKLYLMSQKLVETGRTTWISRRVESWALQWLAKKDCLKVTEMWDINKWLEIQRTCQCLFD